MADLSSKNSNYGFYVQDVWRPNARVTLTLGLRSDSVDATTESRTSKRSRATSSPRGPACRIC